MTGESKVVRGPLSEEELSALQYIVKTPGGSEAEFNTAKRLLGLDDALLSALKQRDEARLSVKAWELTARTAGRAFRAQEDELAELRAKLGKAQEALKEAAVTISNGGRGTENEPRHTDEECSDDSAPAANRRATRRPGCSVS
jgi:hypothetical protein